MNRKTLSDGTFYPFIPDLCHCKKHCNTIVYGGNEYASGHYQIGRSLGKGYHHTEEFKKIQSDAMKGEHRSYSTEFKKGQIPWNIRIYFPHLCECKCRTIIWGNKRFVIGHWAYNRIKSKETKDKIGKKQQNELHWNWQGGKSYQNYPEEFKKKREFILIRDENICIICKRKIFGRSSTVHHIDYNKKNCSENNLITLCRSCNSKANFDRVFYEKYINSIKEYEDKI